MNKEQQPFLTTTPTPATPATKSVTADLHYGRRTATIYVCLIYLCALVPQLYIALKHHYITLLADSLCMIADQTAYLASILVFVLLSTGVRLSRRTRSIVDFTGACVGLLLLIGSASYISVRSINILDTTASKEATEEIDGKWGVIFSIVGGIVDVLCVAVLFYFADPVNATTDKNSDNGSFSFLSVLLHVGGDVLRGVGMLVGGILSLASPKTSALTDATISIIICVVMYLLVVYLFWKLSSLFLKIFGTEKRENGEEEGGGGDGI